MTADRSAASEGGMLGVVLALLRADAPVTITGAPQDWPRWAVLLPHALAAASHFGSLPSQAQGAPGTDAAWLLDRAAARLAEARSLAERALAITEAAYGPDHPTVATLRANLAVSIAGRGQILASGEVPGMEQRSRQGGNVDDSA